jgi:hypothetical protein
MPPEEALPWFDGTGPIRYKHAVVNRALPLEPKKMETPVAGMSRASLRLVALAALLAASGCGRKIGDACATSVDCDPTNGSRTCDLSQRGGYCLIEGCDARSCPEDSHCVRFFPEMFLTGSCELHPACDREPCPTGCAADEACVPGADGEAGVCARRSLERRYCVQSCGGDGDCRGDYQCLPTGVAGVVALTLDPSAKPRFCAPKTSN